MHRAAIDLVVGERSEGPAFFAVHLYTALPCEIHGDRIAVRAERHSLITSGITCRIISGLAVPTSRWQYGLR